MKCLVYREDTINKTHDGGLKDVRSDRKEVWMIPSERSDRCCVCLIDKYLKLCLQTFKRNNFYLHSLVKPTPTQWYGEQVIGQNTLFKTVKRLFEEAKIEGHFTNHSCHRSGMTHLFQAGVDRKLSKEVTGHRFDAVDGYAETSEEKCEMICKIIDKKLEKSIPTNTISVPNCS